jgi:hypothetical protein
VKLSIRLDRAEGHHARYSHSFLRLRDYLVFVAVFFAYVYCGRSDQAYWVKKGLRAQLSGYADVRSAADWFAYVEGDFLDVFFPSEAAGSGAPLSCDAQQFL